MTPRTGSGVTTTIGGAGESPPQPASARRSVPATATRTALSKPLLIDVPPCGGF